MSKSKIAAILIGSVMAVTSVMSLTACGGNNGGPNAFTMWIPSGEQSQYYQDYEENPVLKYLLQREWGEGEDAAQISFDITIPSADSRKDDFGNRIATQNLSDIMDLSLCDYSVEQLYEQGIALDLTELVEQYMPNYKALIDSYPELTRQAYTIIDGERKILHLIGVYDGSQPMYQGFMYRRDWVAEYGEMPSHIWGEDPTKITYTTYAEAEAENDWTGWVTNPAYTGDGQKFTMSYGDDPDNTYTDNVVFPSGTSEPLYISDWEWMFSIFEEAWAALNITDTYCYSPYYMGTDMQGDFASSFGGGAPMWYLNDDEGQIHFGMTESRTRAYVQCMNTWYQNGWLDPEFNRRSSDQFYQIDTGSVYSGEIGAWRGSISALGNAIENDTAPLTEGIMVYGAKLPINDKYGEDENKWVEPDTIYQFGRAGTPVMITRTARDKNLPALLSFIDYLYSEEGALYKTFGFTKEEYEETQDSFYTEWGLTEGAYYTTTADDGTVTYHYAEANPYGTDLEKAVRLLRFPFGLELCENIDRGYSKVVQEAVDAWAYYEDTGSVLSEYVQKVPADQTRTFSNTLANVQDYVYVELPLMMLGQNGWDVWNDASWNDFCEEVNRRNPARITQIFQDIYDLYQTDN